MRRSIIILRSILVLGVIVRFRVLVTECITKFARPENGRAGFRVRSERRAQLKAMEKIRERLEKGQDKKEGG
jgi:hypothetical protein